ncbi:MAG: ABC transporter permease [Peptostreptococcaceae bacterium]|nr:ABC transporter permease [uncultured Criibacterium sp.]MBS6063874.1 ABC transporter permease [Peptostreptococcaceae bacterium]
MDTLKTNKQNNSNLSIAEEFAEKIKSQQKKDKLSKAAPLIVLATIIVLASIFVKGFFSLTNVVNLLNQISIPLVLATGLTFVILIGCIDLSLEGVMGLAGSVVSLLVINNKNGNNFGILAFIIILLLGASIGALTGFLHVKMRIPSFIVTFGMGSVATGFAIMSYMGKPATITDPMFAKLSSGSLLGIPYLTWIAFVVFAVGVFLQKYTAFGASVYAIGDNESIVRANGINIDKVKIKIFAWCALCASVAGIFGAIRLQRGEFSIGVNNLFTTITALVVGGAALSGGKGGMFQSLVGVLSITVIQNCMILIGVNPFIQEAVKGVIIIIAVSLSISRDSKFIVK